MTDKPKTAPQAFEEGPAPTITLDASGTDKSEDRFDADVALSTGLLAPLMGDLIEALGGYMEREVNDEKR